MTIARDPRRRFTQKQRLALAIVAGFRCEICHAQLDFFEADHVRPWSKGGATDVCNGQALCSACNRQKGANYDSQELAEKSDKYYC